MAPEHDGLPAAERDVDVSGPVAAFLVSGGGTVELTGPKCSPNTVHWTYDTYAVASSTAKAVVQTTAS